MLEIEHKFLVKGNDFVNQAFRKDEIKQAYIVNVDKTIVRVRIINDKAWFTFKQSLSMLSRVEKEVEIDVDSAIKIMSLSDKYIITKTRYYVDYEGHVFEVDVFHGDNEGLVVAELEVKDEKEIFSKPNWLGEEVTDDSKYCNSQLQEHPYKLW